MFSSLCMLLGSASTVHPKLQIEICDYGLSPGQRAVFKQIGVPVLPRPKELAGQHHPWFLKAALGEYVKAKAFDAVVWIDSDMLVLKPIEQPLQELCAAMAEANEVVACCPDGLGASMRSFVENWPTNVKPFAELMAAHNVDPELPYLNSGLVLFRDRDFLARWHKMVWGIQPYTLFEQNAFNVAAYEVPGVRPRMLASEEWNRHGNLLPTTDFDQASPPLRILHATSSGQHHTERVLEVRSKGHKWLTKLKLFNEPRLQQKQVDALNAFVAKHHDTLVLHGIFI